MKGNFKIWDMINKKFIESPTFEGIFLSANGNLIKPKEPEVYLMKYFKVVFSISLKDKNGKEIYEGDKVKITKPGTEENQIGEVFYHERFAEFGIKAGNSLGWYILNYYELEVVGNIFEEGEEK